MAGSSSEEKAVGHAGGGKKKCASIRSGVRLFATGNGSGHWQLYTMCRLQNRHAAAFTALPHEALGNSTTIKDIHRTGSPGTFMLQKQEGVS